MASRTLTDVFVLMRNNALQNRHIYNEQHLSDRTALVSDGDSGFELRRSDRPPIWADSLEETHYALSRLGGKIQDLGRLYDKNVLRPTLDDSSMEEHQIEVLTHEITRMFGTTHKLVQQIRQHSSMGDGYPVTDIEKQLSRNVTMSLVASLQELSLTFRRLQNSYLKTVLTPPSRYRSTCVPNRFSSTRSSVAATGLNMREERSKQFFDTALDIDLNSDSTTIDLNNWGSGGFDLTSEAENLDRQFSFKSMMAGGADQAQAQLLMLEEENTRLAAHHETEVQGIVKSILDLNDIFKDLAHMVVEQGTVLDRIDYNIEQTQTQVHQGYQQLRKAEEYHRKNRKMVCIIVLASVTMFLTFLLIIVKT